MINEISIVIGSWGSYNACNKRALGSKWLNLSDFDSWDEIEEELKKEGFILDGIDAELFIQDIDGFPCRHCNWDYIHPKTFFEMIKESEVLDSYHKFEKMEAYLEIRDYDDFENLVNSDGCNWDDDIYLYPGQDWEDFGREYFENCGYKLPSNLEDFIDFEAYGKYIGDYYAYEYSNGIIEICR